VIDYLIVGSGLFGAVFAREMTDRGKKCLIIEKRSHIGGNVYSENRDGIEVHTYGPHIFHTNSDEIWSYVNRFAKFNNFVNRPKVRYGDKVYSFPINLMTLHQLWGVGTPSEARSRLEAARIQIDDPQNLEDHVLSQVGREIYETFIKGYTKKQWQRDPKELPPDIIKRLPIRLTYDDNYFFDKYQGIPIGGYHRMMQNILEGIEVKTGVDYFENRDHWNSIASKVVYTGMIDQFYDYRLGELEYRSLGFESETLVGDYQGNAVVNYSSEQVPHTRVVEHKHFEPENLKKNSEITVITREFPKTYTRGDVPYYPINDSKNMKAFHEYEKMATLDSNRVIFGGRLSEYRYYDMHQVIGSALVKSKREIENTTLVEAL